MWKCIKPDTNDVFRDKKARTKLPLKYLEFAIQEVTISEKNMGKTAIWIISCFLPPSPLLTKLRKDDENLRQAMLWISHFV